MRAINFARPVPELSARRASLVAPFSRAKTYGRGSSVARATAEKRGEGRGKKEEPEELCAVRINVI